MSLSREAALFALAAAKPVGEQAAFLARECADDPELRRRLAERLARHERELAAASSTESVKGPATVVAPVSWYESEGTLIGRYKLLERIGEGGFGVVWAAEQREPVRRRVALKIIKLGLETKQVVARFEAERQALALMDHPNIAKVLDAGVVGGKEEGRGQKEEGSGEIEGRARGAEAGLEGGAIEAEGRAAAGGRFGPGYGRPYFVMELVKGVPITRYCEQESLAIRERLDLFVKVCHAIQHAHQKGIIHRDIKPSNILVTLHDGVPVPKVIDFGIAKATQQELTELTLYTQHHQFIGTPAYMSPEQAEMSGLDIDTRSDIYSLGVLLYELLTGSTPFDTKELLRSGLDAMRKIIREREPLRPSTRIQQASSLAATSRPGGRSSIDSDLDWITLKCLEKDRTRRYETANGLAADITRHLRNEPVVARPPRLGYRLQKAWQRNQLAYTAILIIAVAQIAGICVSLWQAVRATRAEEIARERAKLEHRARVNEAAARRETEAARQAAELSAAVLETNLYFSRVAQAHAEASAYPARGGLAETLLDLCPEPLRNWEWHYVKRLRFHDPVQIHDSGNPVAHCVVFSGDNRHLAWGRRDGTIRFWDFQRAELAGVITGHTAAVIAVAFSPGNPDWIASAGLDGMVRLWDWRARRDLGAWPAAVRRVFGMAYSVAWSPDGRQLAVPTATNRVLVRSVPDGRELWDLPSAESDIYAVDFSPNGRWMATGGAHGEIRLWDASTRQPGAILSSISPPTAAVAFSADSTRLTAVQFDGLVRIWDVATGAMLSAFSARTSGEPTVGLALHPNGERVATAGLDRLVALWQPDGARVRQALLFREFGSPCYALAFSPDGNRLAAAGRGERLWIWDATPIARLEDDPSFLTLSHPGPEVWALDVAPNGRDIATAGSRTMAGSGSNSVASAFFWRGPEYRNPVALRGHRIHVFSAAFDLAGGALATSGDEPDSVGAAKARVWDLNTGRELFPLEAFEGDERLFSILYHPAARWIVAAGVDNHIKVWDAGTGRRVGVAGSHTNEITALAFSVRGKYLASVGNDDVARLWDGARLDRAQARLREFPAASVGPTDSLAFSPDEARLALVRDDATIAIHEVAGGGAEAPQWLKQERHRPAALVFGPDGRWLASGGFDATIRIWDVRGGRWVRSLKGHLGPVVRLRVVTRERGSMLISASRDGTVKFWDMAALEQSLAAAGSR